MAARQSSVECPGSSRVRIALARGGGTEMTLSSEYRDTIVGGGRGRAMPMRALVRIGTLLLATALAAGCGGSGEGSIIPPKEVGSITIDTPSFLMERGTDVTL